MTQDSSEESPAMVPLWLFSEALDEIYELRRAMAYESLGRLADLELKSFPKSRRTTAADSAERMAQSARGKVSRAYARTPYASLRSSLRNVGADECLTRAQWENEKPRRSS